MDKFAVMVACGLIGLLLYWRGSGLYHRVALGESVSTELHVLAVGMYGLSAGLLFITLILGLSYQSPDFSWDSTSVLAIVSIAGILGLVVAVVTAVKIFAFRRLQK